MSYLSAAFQRISCIIAFAPCLVAEHHSRVAEGEGRGRMGEEENEGNREREKQSPIEGDKRDELSFILAGFLF